MRSPHCILVAAAVCGTFFGSQTVSAANRVINVQTVVWVSKENPAQKKAVAKFGEVYGFAPDTIVVNQGDHVVLHIRNLEAGGDDGHTFTLPGYHVNATLPPLSSETVTFTASKPGVFAFFCEFHKPWMSGRLVVLAAR